MERGTIDYEVLPEEAQQIIDDKDTYPWQHFTYYARPRTEGGYEIQAISGRDMDMLEASGGMGEEWLLVTSVQDEEDREDPVLPNFPPVDEEDE